MTSIIMILTYLKYHIFNFLLDSQYQDFNILSIKPVKPIKNYHGKKFMLIIFYEIFLVSPIAYFVYTIQLIKFVACSL